MTTHAYLVPVISDPTGENSFTNPIDLALNANPNWQRSSWTESYSDEQSGNPFNLKYQGAVVVVTANDPTHSQLASLENVTQVVDVAGRNAFIATYFPGLTVDSNASAADAALAVGNYMVAGFGGFNKTIT